MALAGLSGLNAALHIPFPGGLTLHLMSAFTPMI